MGGWGHSFPNENHNFWTNENSPFVFPNLTKTLGWVHRFDFFGTFPNNSIGNSTNSKKEENLKGRVCAKLDKWVKEPWHNSSAENLNKRQKQNTFSTDNSNNLSLSVKETK